MIYLIRHGEDDESYIGGWSNVGLTEKGKKQVKIISLWINENLNIKKIISSDIKRSIETAEIISETIKVNYSTDKFLREQNKGDLNGKKIDFLSEKEKKLKQEQKIDTIYPNGETLIDLYNRIKNNLSYFSKLDDDTLIVTHRGVINMLYYILNNISLDMNKKRFNVAHASIHELDIKNKLIRRIK